MLRDHWPALPHLSGGDPITWKGWWCLHIELPDNDQDLDCFVWIKSIIEAYLPNIEGRTFFCSHKHIYIICKETAHDNLIHISTLISDFLVHEHHTAPRCVTYDLFKEGTVFSDIFFKTMKLGTHERDMPDHILNRMQELSLFRMLEQQEYNESQTNLNTVKVLLVEDDPVTRWMVRNALKYECNLATVSEAHKAFDMYASFQPDIVFLDINLPDTNGYDVLQWIMHNDPGASVVMFSSNDNLDNIASAMDQGARGFIAKPFLKDQLLHYIHNQTR